MLKAALSRLASLGVAEGVSILIYHRVGGGSADERDVTTDAFIHQLDVLKDLEVVSLDDGLQALRRSDARPRVVLTFDDGFADVYAHAWPLLRDRAMPFTIYLSTAFVGGTMHWDGSTAKDRGGPALSWSQLAEMVSSGLCTIGNHTHTHARPGGLTEDELDRCNNEATEHLGVVPAHFAYTWGVYVPRAQTAIRTRFRSAATGELGRNLPGQDPMRLARIPVRRTDPAGFFAAKLSGNLWQEHAYARAVALAKRAGVRA